MLERYVTALALDDAGLETPAETRDRLREHFAKGATRRMTQLGMLLGAPLQAVAPAAEDTLVYLSAYAETRALEGYLESFPTPSPTLFQTSIHPSSVQQNLIGRQQTLRRFFPMAGRHHGVAQALTVALLDGPAAVFCGGEERGTWLLEQGAASDRTFAFALRLVGHAATGAVARVTLSPSDEYAAPTPLPLPEFFDALRARRDLNLVTPAGARLGWTWLMP